MRQILRNFKIIITFVLIIGNHRTLTVADSPPQLNNASNSSKNVNNTNVDESSARTLTQLSELQSSVTKPSIWKDPSLLTNSIDSQGIVSSINGIKTQLDALSSQINPFKFVDIFINQWRNTIPLLATKGNFTLLQAALLCAVGSIAAGAALITAEAFYFKTQNDEAQFHAAADHHHSQQNYYNKLPSLTYGRRNFDGSLDDQQLQSTTIRASTLHPAALAKYYESEWKRLNKPQSLKRSQRRRQRKNKNFYDRPKKSPGRTKRQISRRPSSVSETPTIEADNTNLPNSFNQFYLNPSNTTSSSKITYPHPTRNDNNYYDVNYYHNQNYNYERISEEPSPSPTFFAGPRAPPPLQTIETEHSRPDPSTNPNSTGKFDIFALIRNGLTYFLNYMFDKGGSVLPGNLGYFSINGQQNREIYFPKLNPNRNFIRRNFKNLHTS